jgi:hypothetical protein
VIKALLQIATGDKQTGMSDLKILATEEQKNGKINFTHFG